MTAAITTTRAPAATATGRLRLLVTPTALLGLLSPLTAALLGHLAVSEVLSPAQHLGFALALTAMTAGQLAPPSSRFSCG